MGGGHVFPGFLNARSNVLFSFRLIKFIIFFLLTDSFIKSSSYEMYKTEYCYKLLNSRKQ